MRKNWCFWTVVLEKALESPLDCKDIKLVNPKGNQSWIFFGRTDADVSVFWPGEFHGLYSPWGHEESDRTEWLSLSLSKSISSENRGIFTSSFPICMSFILFSCLIALDLPVQCWIELARVDISLILGLSRKLPVFQQYLWISYRCWLTLSVTHAYCKTLLYFLHFLSSFYF